MRTTWLRADCPAAQALTRQDIGTVPSVFSVLKHGRTSLTLLIPSGNYNILPTIIGSEIWPCVAVVCGLCGLHTATFVRNPRTLRSYEELRTAALEEWT